MMELLEKCKMILKTWKKNSILCKNQTSIRDKVILFGNQVNDKIDHLSPIVGRRWLSTARVSKLKLQSGKEIAPTPRQKNKV